MDWIILCGGPCDGEICEIKGHELKVGRRLDLKWTIPGLNNFAEYKRTKHRDHARRPIFRFDGVR